MTVFNFVLTFGPLQHRKKAIDVQHCNCYVLSMITTFHKYLPVHVVLVICGLESKLQVCVRLTPQNKPNILGYSLPETVHAKALNFYD